MHKNSSSLYTEKIGRSNGSGRGLPCRKEIQRIPLQGIYVHMFTFDISHAIGHKIDVVKICKKCSGFSMKGRDVLAFMRPRMCFLNTANTFLYTFLSGIKDNQ